jgi:hypothetical protein
MDVLVLVTNPRPSATWSAQQRLTRWARVMEWHDYARELHDRGRLPWAWGLRMMLETTRPTAVCHGLAAIYQVDDLQELSCLLDDDPLRDVSEYLSVPLAGLDEDFANDTERFERAKRALIGDDPVALVKYAEYEAVTAQAPSYVDAWAQRLPANPPVDFDTRSEPGDPLEVFVYGVNPNGYIESWDDLRHLLHYQKVLWWHHYTWMLAGQGIKTHSWGTHDFCNVVFNSSKSASAFDVFRVPTLERFSDVFALDPIRDDSLYQVALLRPIAEQRRSDERRAVETMRRTGATLARLPVGLAERR